MDAESLAKFSGVLPVVVSGTVALSMLTYPLLSYFSKSHDGKQIMSLREEYHLLFELGKMDVKDIYGLYTNKISEEELSKKYSTLCNLLQKNFEAELAFD